MGEFTLTGLRVVQAVAEAGSFSAAAELLGYTQSAVSRQVAATESVSGTILFRRGPRGVVATAAGTALVRRSRTVLDELAAAQHDLATLADGISGKVVVGAFPTAAAVLVPRTMGRLRDVHPGLRVELREGSTPTTLRRLRTGQIDVGVAAVGDGLPDYDLDSLVTQVLPGAGLWLAVPADHRLVGRHDAAAAELANERWIVGDGLRSDPQFGAWPTVANPVVVHSAPSLSTRLGLVAAGLGVALIPLLAARSVPHDVRVVRITDATWSGRRSLAFVREDAGSLARTVVEELVACAAELSAARPAGPAEA